MKNFRLGIIGCGNMAQAIVKGIASNDTTEFFKNAVLNITISDKNKDKLDYVKSLGYLNLITTDNNVHLVNKNDYIILAVKPQSFTDTVKNLDLKNKIVISIMAGINTDNISTVTGAKKIVRIMPNLNAKIGCSFNSFHSSNLDTHENAFVNALTECFGVNVKIAENDFYSATGIAGSGPAFVFMFIKSFIDTACKYGFSKHDSIRMAIQTIEGSTRHIAALSDHVDLDDLVMSVCSKGGATIEGVNYLQETEFESIVKTAIEKSINRAKELEQA